MGGQNAEAIALGLAILSAIQSGKGTVYVTVSGDKYQVDVKKIGKA